MAIGEVIYALCAITSAACAFLLFRAYGHSKLRLLFWCGLGFAGLFFNNALLFADKIIFLDVDLSMVRLLTAIAAYSVLIFGLVWDGDR